MCRGDHGRKNLAELRKEYEGEVRETLLPLLLRHWLGGLGLGHAAASRISRNSPFLARDCFHNA